VQRTIERALPVTEIIVLGFVSNGVAWQTGPMQFLWISNASPLLLRSAVGKLTYLLLAGGGLS